jgi:hypothetical protein
MFLEERAMKILALCALTVIFLSAGAFSGIRGHLGVPQLSPVAAMTVIGKNRVNPRVGQIAIWPWPCMAIGCVEG